MRNTKFFTTAISILTAILMMFMVSFTVFATGELGTLVPPQDDAQPTQVVIDDVQQTDAVGEPDYEFDDSEDTDTDSDDDDDGIVVIDPTWEETQAPTYYDVYSEELPQVESQDITEPPTEPIPEVEVSDTSLIGGVIAWLCVAVGIAVIAGVLVSQRTRQTGGSQNRESRRR